MAEQLPLDFTASATVRHRRAVKAAAAEDQPTLFASWSPNLDIHLHTPAEAIAQITGPEPERAHHWLAGIVGSVRVLKTRRVAFPTASLDRLLHVRPPAQISLDAACVAVGRGLWAHKLGLKPLRVTRERQRLIAASPRWPTGFGVKDVPWTAIAALTHLGVPLDVEPRARTLFNKKLSEAGTKIAVAGLAGSAVIIEARQPTIVENLGLPALAYSGEQGTGRYKLPLLCAEPLLRQNVIDIPPDLEAAIRKATGKVKPLTDLPASFPWTLYPFQARDAGQAERILETTGGVLLAGDMGSGKSILMDGVVLTPRGPARAGDIQVGDELIGRDGKATRVLGVFLQGERDMWRLTFTDGATAVADDEHLWAVHSPVMKKRGRPGKVLTTRELRDGGLRDAAGNLRWYIPLCEPVQFERGDQLPLDPYLLGVLLGDGTIGAGSVSFTSADPFIVEEIRRLLPDGCAIVHRPHSEAGRARAAADRGCAPADVGDWNYGLTGGTKLTGPLRVLGLMGKRSWEKSVPDSYRYAPEHDRRALLQGLLDTDGGVKNQRQLSSIEFTSTSEQLADDVIWLAQSLGGTGRKSAPVRKTYTYQGEKRRGRPCWRVSLALPDHVTPFRLPRKAEQYRPRVKYQPTRGITDISPAGRGDAVCFKVDAVDELFLLEHGVATHNTTVSLALVEHLGIWPLLVVAPLSAFSTWARQLGELGRSHYLATETPSKSWEAIEHGGHDAVVISYDRLPAFVELIERMQFRGIVADELQRIRTPGSKRSRALRALASSVPMRIGLSGTPLSNYLTDLLPQGAFLAPGEWKPRASSKDLEDLYPGDPVEAVAEHLGALMVRRRMEDTGAKLPNRNDHRVLITLTPEQRRALAELEAEAEAAKENGEFDDPSSKMHAFVRLQRMRQIVNSPSAAGVLGPNPKVIAAVELAEDFLAAGRKGVIFTADRTSFREIGKALDEAGIGWVGIWGATPPAQRIENERRFHTDPDVKVVLCTIQAGSESWSASPTATWLISTAYVYTPATLSQMEARVYRLNSKVDGPSIEICYVHAQAPGGSLDDRMVEILEVKKELFAQVVDRRTHVDTTKVHMSMADLVYLLTGKRDEKLAKREADAKATQAREQAKKDHARGSAHKHKQRNKDFIADDGATALTLEQYQAAAAVDDDTDLDELLAAADADETGALGLLDDED